MRHILPILIISVSCGTMLSALPSYADDAPVTTDAQPTSAPVTSVSATDASSAPATDTSADQGDIFSSFRLDGFSDHMPNWLTNPGGVHLFTPSQEDAAPATTSEAPQPVSTTPPPAPGTPIKPGLMPDYVEAGTNYSAVSHDEGNWAGEYGRAEKQTDPDNRWNATLVHQDEFHRDAYYGAIGNTHIFNDDWYSDVSAGASPEGLVLPQYRFDATLNRKLLDSRDLIGMVGMGEYLYRDSHRTTTFFVGDAWYFDPRWVLQDGVNFNISSPGSVDSASAFIAMTEGRNKNYYLTGRFGFGREAYQVIAPGNAISDFASQDYSISWRQWMLTDWGYDDNWGFILGSEYYTNPYYHRVGGNIALFREF